ncbi:MAG: OmpH family outer membrane protein [Bacteroidales bacterium]|jgi:outer membrane protein|nr:OmpH family outer membrane protein [Bacteroidales bacterium]
MKKRAIQVLALAIMFSLTSSVFAQKAVKLGHFNSSELIKRMPESDSAQATLKAYVEDIQKELEGMQKEYQRLVDDYQAKESQLSELLKANKQQEIKDVSNRYQAFQEKSQNDIQTKQTELMQKIFDKIRGVVEQVAKDNHYDYVFESNGILWYSNDSDDITPLIEKKLKLKK